jgi:peptidylprolyl isomerase
MYHNPIMKFTPTLFLLAASAPLLAQTSAAHTAHPAAARTSAAACVKLPEFNSKIPPLPAGITCAHHLYTLTTIPAIKVENISPLEPSTLKEDLGIESTTFSLDYIDTRVGSGELAGQNPAKKWYSVNYTGYLPDGTKFDSSLDRGEPIVIPYGGHQVIPGWDTGFAGMRVGGKRRLLIPYQLAYGASAKGPIPAKSNLIFDVELVSLSDTQPKPKAPPTPPPTGAVPPPPADGAKPATQPSSQPSSQPTNPPAAGTTTSTPPKP